MNISSLANRISPGGLAQAIDLRVLAMAMNSQKEQTQQMVQAMAQSAGPAHLGGSIDIRV